LATSPPQSADAKVRCFRGGKYFSEGASVIKDLIELHHAAVELEERASHGEHLTKQEKDFIRKEAVARMLWESLHGRQYQSEGKAAEGSVRRRRALAVGP
jgi:hypothetical protein